VGTEIGGRISGVQRFGVFVKLDETGADGLVPIRSIGQEFFHFDRENQTLMGADTGQIISLGQRVTVRLVEAAPVTGGLILELLEIEGGGVARGPRKQRGRGPQRKPARAAHKARKVTRQKRQR